MFLSPEAARVLGCLIEKSQATPEYYPMSLNALVAACNQKTSRDPVVEYGEEEVEEALVQLRDKGLCAFVSGEGRVMKYAHRGGDSGLALSAAQLAALSLMLLRGAQTIGEIKNRAGRQHEFASLEEVQDIVNTLISREPSLAEQAPRQTGQKEVRYRHLLFEHGENVEAILPSAASFSLREEVEELKHKLAEMQKRVERLEEITAKLKADLY
jgi:uncharacterized protein YceH (UPF0502 family)